MSKYVEFPELTPEASKILVGAHQKAFPNCSYEHRFADRIYAASILREAMYHAALANGDYWGNLHAIANNLHAPPPTLAEAREAARQLGGANAEVVHAYLATLGEGNRENS